jgi:NadR type nicotinamide-nucleotide adenylyltransferase
MAKENDNIIRIALIGPESTSKSTLSEGLANYYTTVWVKEYAREYLTRVKKKYIIEDILAIAREQLKKEQELILQANKFIFADTELIISKVWCEDVFKTCPAWILENILHHKYDFYLLTFPDIPWQEDSLRENPHRRDFFFDWYERELKNIHANYTIIKGTGKARLESCIDAIEAFFKIQ